jgi:AbrB family looped-hinge helix DNA binding protein
MKQIAVRVEKTGRILIPVDIRRQLNLVEGESEVLLNVDDTGVIKVTTRKQALDRIRAEIRKHIPAGVSLADELLTDRRREASEEDRK